MRVLAITGAGIFRRRCGIQVSCQWTAQRAVPAIAVSRLPLRIGQRALAGSTRPPIPRTSVKELVARIDRSRAANVTFNLLRMTVVCNFAGATDRNPKRFGGIDQSFGSAA
jgi:hypothetical protein